MSAVGGSGTTSSAAPTRPTWRSGRSWRGGRGPMLDLGCGTGRVAPRPGPARALRWTASTSTPSLSATSAEGAGARPAVRRRRAPTPAIFELDARASRWSWRRCSSSSCSAARRSGSPACAASPRTCSRWAVVAVAIVEGMPASSRSAAAAARRPRGRRLGLLQPAGRAPRPDGGGDRRPAPAPDRLPERRAERGAERRSTACDCLDAGELEAEAARGRACGRPAAVEIPPTDGHVGSTVVAAGRRR